MYKITAAVIMFMMMSCSFAGENVPKFGDYLASSIYKGKHAKLATKADNEYFKNILTEATSQPVNFSGHYIVFHYSCGGGCITGGVIDAITGKLVADFPDNYISGDQPESFKSQYKVNSKLIIITGSSAYEDQGARTNYYKFENNEFILIKSSKKE